MLREAAAHKQRSDAQLATERNSSGSDIPVSLTDSASFGSIPNKSKSGEMTVLQDDGKGGRTALRCMNSKMLTNIWLQCIEKCHSKTLRQLLHSHGRLVSISEVKGKSSI